MVIEDAPRLATPLRGLLHQSKITVPPVSGIPRPHLVARLAAGASKRLTVVSAPAGWGKSTLVTEWARQSEWPVAWVSLDEGDTNLQRFFEAVVAAIDRVYPARLEDLRTLLRSPSMVADDAMDSAIVAHMESLPGPVVIVLDDFHLLTGDGQLRSISRLIELMPATVHLIITTRGELRLPLARLRAAGDVTVMRTADLAFSETEARLLFNDQAGLACDDHAIRSLVERTEGWAAGLRLAALAMQTDSRAIERLRGTQRDIADYFREEVLNRLDPEQYRLLVEMAPLERFTAALATHVTGINAESRFLPETLADAFVVPLDEDRQWYRYHPLLRDVLTDEFSRLPGERQVAVHVRASAWLERQGLVLEAVEHALAGQDTGRVAILIETHADQLMFSCGRSHQLVTWIDRLPPESVLEQPALLRVRAWALTMLGELDQAEQLLERARCEVRASPAWDGLLAAVEARLAAYRGDHQATITLGERALAALDPIGQAQVRSDVLLSMGFAWRALGDLERAIALFSDASRLGRSQGNDQAARWGSRYGALTLMMQGKLREAEAIVDQDLERRVDGQEPGGTYAALLVTKAEALTERGERILARQKLDEALPIILHVGDAKTLMNAYVALATLYQLDGNGAAAREKLRRAEEVFPSQVRGARIARMDLREENHGAARRWASTSGFSMDDAVDPARGEDEQFIFARIMAEEDPAALGLLQRLAASAEAGGRFGRLLDILVEIAVVQARHGNQQAAQEALARAIGLASIEGFIRPFLVAGHDVLPVLRELGRDRQALNAAGRQFALRLMARMGGDDAAPAPETALVEQLTTRQHEILRLMADGRSNRDIAAALFIAEGTVKAHIHQITGKLMARNRTEAVATARRLHLL